MTRYETQERRIRLERKYIWLELFFFRFSDDEPWQFHHAILGSEREKFRIGDISMLKAILELLEEAKAELVLQEMSK